jgi:hypothetical protein
MARRQRSTDAVIVGLQIATVCWSLRPSENSVS